MVWAFRNILGSPTEYKNGNLNTILTQTAVISHILNGPQIMNQKTQDRDFNLEYVIPYGKRPSVPQKARLQTVHLPIWKDEYLEAILAKWAEDWTEKASSSWATRLKDGLQGRDGSTVMPEMWITWSWRVSQISVYNEVGDLGDTDSLSVSSVPDTIGYFTYMLSINPPRDLAVNIIIPTLQIRKLAQILTYLGQGHMTINSRVSFQTKVCSLQNLFLFNVSHCFPNRGRSPRILRKIKNTCWIKGNQQISTKPRKYSFKWTRFCWVHIVY